MKKHNFGAGPCILPVEVLQKASEAVINLDNSGLSLIEISHRSEPFVKIMDKARSLVRELLDIPASHSVIFLQGGASLQFMMIAQNLIKKGGKAAYTDTGVWSSKAIKEAKLFGNIEVIASSENNDYRNIPKEYIIPSDIDYFHCTSNNTIYGTQMRHFPECPSVMVCDMSSDIFSREIDVNKFDLIYAGAQKNMGTAGATLVIVRDDILGKTGLKIPIMLDYKEHIYRESMNNTPPVFAIYVSMLTLQWVKDKGGVKALEKMNTEKAKLLYDAIDNNKYFKAKVSGQDRSLMNVTFDVENSKSELFELLCSENGIVGIKGHRISGGYRASIYNAMPIESIRVLVDIINKTQ
ncbi:MAG: 3-phosphoserine/phosphohydroxythreonine transaminase [Flavobacteriaceae bacterium]|nr:3-phosphoserine/phosphohydroxythreonine transaminase [Flavobacteriaceae bacterium]